MWHLTALLDNLALYYWNDKIVLVCVCLLKTKIDNEWTFSPVVHVMNKTTRSARVKQKLHKHFILLILVRYGIIAVNGHSFAFGGAFENVQPGTSRLKIPVENIFYCSSCSVSRIWADSSTADEDLFVAPCWRKLLAVVFRCRVNNIRHNCRKRILIFLQSRVGQK